MTKAFRNGKKALWLLAGIIVALLLAAALLWWGRPVEARPALADYVGDLDGYETVRITRQDGQTLTLEEPQAAELKELLDQFSFTGAAEEKTSRASAPGFEAVVQLTSVGGTAHIITFVTGGADEAHVRLDLSDGTTVHITGAFQTDYRAAADFINGL